jgi:hypothetical protein
VVSNVVCDCWLCCRHADRAQLGAGKRGSVGNQVGSVRGLHQTSRPLIDDEDVQIVDAAATASKPTTAESGGLLGAGSAA